MKMVDVPETWKGIITGTVIKYEGGYDKFTNDPVDRGGPTKAGITLKFYKDYAPSALGYVPTNPIQEMQNLDPAEIDALYYMGIVQASGLYRLESSIWYAGLKNVYDFAVLAGPTTAIKALQRTVGVQADGIIGPNTISAITPGFKSAEYCFERIKHHVEDVKRNPEQLRFLAGWVNRACDNYAH